MNVREDAVLLELFEAEIETHMTALNEGLIALENDPTQAHFYEPMMRAAHSIKGASSLFDLNYAIKLSHVIEDTFDSARAGRLAVNSELVDVLFRGVDLLARVARINDEQDAKNDDIELVINLIEEVSKGNPNAATKITSDPERRPTILNASWVENVHKSIGHWMDSGVTDLVLNLDQVKHIDPGALALLVMASSLSDKDRRLVLNNASHSLLALLSGMGVSPRAIASSNCLT